MPCALVHPYVPDQSVPWAGVDLDVDRGVDLLVDGAVGQAHVDEQHAILGPPVEDFFDLAPDRLAGDGDGNEFGNNGIRHFVSPSTVVFDRHY